MKPIKLITLDHDCCAVCRNLLVTAENLPITFGTCEVNCKIEKCDYCLEAPTTKDPKCLTVYDPYNTICAGDNFKRREK